MKTSKNFSYIYSLVKKHLTLTNFICGLISIIVAALIKFSPAGLYVCNMLKIAYAPCCSYILGATGGLIARLGLKGGSRRDATLSNV